jgi:serine/threonine protein kinase
LVHRDVKPSNILIDTSNKPFLVDFGLALKEEDFGKGGGVLGTPAYMSPEQANGEGHLVDGRSDIFSLGVVLYELLVGKRPFRGDSQAELIDQITQIEARPPRQIDGTIPKELERICLKTLAKKSTERYTAAKDIAEELEHFLAQGVKQSVPYSMEPPQEVAQGRHTNEAYALEIANGVKEGHFYTLDKERIVIGRNPDCDIPLLSPAVGRYHTQLVRSPDGYLIEDLQSRNSTHVNGTTIIGRVALKDKDRIHIGGMILIYHKNLSEQME